MLELKLRPPDPGAEQENPQVEDLGYIDVGYRLLQAT
jgi:hypothetical protein